MTLILIVDDALLTRKILSKKLQSNGYETIEASSGSQALNMIRQQKPDCILLDLLLPEYNGFEILEILQQEKSKIPVIVITADTQTTSRDKCLELGAQTIINKPPKTGELLRVIQQAIGLNQEQDL